MTRCRRAGRTPGPRDAGLTLIELMVTMAIMGVVLTMVTGAIIAMYGSTAKVEGITSTSAQVSIALSKLDSSVRYADDIGDPVTDGSGNWYVTYRSTYNGISDCTQLRFDIAAQQLQRRTWVAGPAATASAWQPLASGLVLTAADSSTAAPFTLTTSRDIDSLDTAVHQQLRLRFSAVSGAGDRQTMSTTDVTFTAFNANVNSALGRTTEYAKCQIGVTP